MNEFLMKCGPELILHAKRHERTLVCEAALHHIIKWLELTMLVIPAGVLQHFLEASQKQQPYI